MLTAGFERREEHLATDAGFAVTERDTNSLFGIYQLRVDDHALQGNLRRDDSSQYGGKTTGSHRLRLSFRRRRCASRRATRPASRRRRSTISTSPVSPIPISCPKPPRTSKAASTGTATSRARTLEARAIVYRNRVSQLIIFNATSISSARRTTSNRATLEGVTLGLEARRRQRRDAPASLDIQSPEDDRHGQAPAAARAPARRVDRGLSGGAGPLGRGARRVVPALRRSGQPREDGRLRASSTSPRNGRSLPASRCSREPTTSSTRTIELAAGFGTGGRTVFAGCARRAAMSARSRGAMRPLGGLRLKDRGAWRGVRRGGARRCGARGARRGEASTTRA